MSSTGGDDLRAEAVKRVKAKQNFWRMAGGFVILWIIMIAIWAMTGDGREHNYFWPGWVIFGTGIALAFTGWNAYGPRSTVTDAQVDAEMRKMSGDS